MVLRRNVTEYSLGPGDVAKVLEYDTLRHSAIITAPIARGVFPRLYDSRPVHGDVDGIDVRFLPLTLHGVNELWVKAGTQGTLVNTLVVIELRESVT